MKKILMLTEKQKEYAAKNHNIVYRYLRRKGLSEDDYYDIVAPGYLRAVVKYTEREDLQHYRFSTIAWRAMDSDLINHYRYMNRKKRKAEVLSLDADLSADNDLSMHDILAAKSNPAQDLDDKLLWLEVYSHLNECQWNLIKMRITGYSKRDISRQLKIPFSEIDMALLSVWNCIKGLFDKELPLTDRGIL